MKKTFIKDLWKRFYKLVSEKEYCIFPIIQLNQLEKLGSLSTKQFKKVKSESLPRVCKIHKAFADILYKLHVIRTPNYKRAKFLVPNLFSIRFNEFTVKDSFTFRDEIVYQDRKLFMGSLDVD